MVLDFFVDRDSITMEISDPFHPDLDGLMNQIVQFARSKSADIDAMAIKELIPKIIRGIAGCENGCPADAKGLVSRGFKGFELQYIEGGILSARATLGDGRPVHLKMFPEF